MIILLLTFILSNPTAEIYIEGMSKPLRCELYKDIVPKTVQNFIQISKGINYNNNTKSYSGSIFHRLIKDFVVQGGDILKNNGTGSISIYGDKFEDENFIKKHYRGSLSMANSGRDTNGSQFFICMKQLEFLDNRHVVFGQVYSEDFDLLELINVMPTNNSDKPLRDIVIREIKIKESKEL